ncbi:hypothetical protein cypCar_00029535 [Cyprinus carpio]|nr:hypothetical protein cypCar_00029535 [Cyprinus carpio]
MMSSYSSTLEYQAWAQTSVSGDGRINGDPSVWKRNFRSALRAKGFKIIFDSKNDAANPHKVYQFPSEPHSAVSGSEGSQETDFMKSGIQISYIWGLKNKYSSKKPVHVQNPSILRSITK